ncbi:MAG: diguanylate cyclase [Betaproteobacteria bacterium]
MTDRPRKGRLDQATLSLKALEQQADGMRAELTQLQRHLVDIRHEFDELPVSHVRDANEQLVLAALRAETLADEARIEIETLERSNQRDALTGAPNRALVIDRLGNAIALARRHKGRFAVLFVDLDHFKPINDTMGHAVGDEVLRMVARRLQTAVRDSDTVGRWGGDEFLVLLSDIARPDDAAMAATKILTALAEPGYLGERALRISASIGIAMFPEDGEHASTLVHRADQAMYRAKKAGRSGFEFHRERTVDDAGAQAADPLSREESHLSNLREANEQLVVAALTSQTLEGRAEDALRRQTRFLTMVTHELRNPLNPMRAVADLLGRDRTSELLRARAEVTIKRQLAQMSRLVNDLLDESGATTGHFRIERSPIEIEDILALVVETCRPILDSKLQHLKRRFPPGPVRVNGDPVRLAQVFINLLDNAAQFTQEGGEIAIAAELRHGAVAITVSDNGIGITAEALPHIFDLDKRAKSLPGGDSGHLGIGLVVVRDLVEAHGGTVSASSAGAHLGSEFSVNLPTLADPDATRPGDLVGATLQ